MNTTQTRNECVLFCCVIVSILLYATYNTHVHTCTHPLTHVHIHSHMYTLNHMYTPTRKCTHPLTHFHTHSHMYIHSHMYTPTHTYTSTHTCTHPLTHVHTDSLMYTFTLIPRSSGIPPCLVPITAATSLVAPPPTGVTAKGS